MGKSVGIKCRLAAAKDWKEGEKELTDNGHRVLLGVVNMFYNWIMVMIVQLCEYTQNQ